MISRTAPISLALLTMGLTPLPARAADLPTPAQISVSGEAFVEAAPDYAEMRVGVVTQAAQAKAAMEANATRMERIRKALASAGIAARDIQTSQMMLQPQYHYGEKQPPNLVGYQMQSQLRIISRDLKNTGALLDILVAQGVNQIEGPSFGTSHIATLRDKARLAALADAQARAALYAKAAGLRVKRIIDISESTADPMPPQPMLRVMASEAAPPSQISAGSISVRATVSLRAELE